MDKPKTSVSNTASGVSLFGRLSGRMKRNKSLTAVSTIIAAVAALSSLMVLTDSENSPGLLVALFVLVTVGLFCTLGIIFEALDDK